MHFKSIQTKFVALGLSCIVLCVALVGGFGVWSTSEVLSESSDRILSLTCNEEAGFLNEELFHIQGSVTSCAELVKDALSSPDYLRDGEWLGTFVEQADSFVGSIARNTPDVCAYYLRLNPEVCAYDTGFFYVRSGRDPQFKPQEITDVRQYGPSDLEHVGWYYQPLALRKPIWMEPYSNDNIGVYMVSYVIPLFVDETFVGVVGMDVDFDMVINVVRHIQPYETGRAYLVSRAGQVYFHPEYAPGSLMKDDDPQLGLLVDGIEDLRIGEQGVVTTYATENGVERKVASCGLRNGMVLMLEAETSEIGVPVRELVTNALLVGLLIALVAVLLLWRLSRRITSELAQLVEVADRITEGNLDVEFPEATDDEVGTLTRSLSTTVSSLRSYIDGMSAKAYRDELTMVKNKAAYSEEIERLERQMAGGESSFGILMLDVNDLKAMNDENGHGHGDDYLRENCRAICHVFEHSPVYRVGGDEFVVILEGRDYEQRDELMRRLDEVMEASCSEADPWKHVALAKGLAIREEGDASTDEVFSRADSAMYEDKRRIKAGR